MAAASSVDRTWLACAGSHPRLLVRHCGDSVAWEGCAVTTAMTTILAAICPLENDLLADDLGGPPGQRADGVPAWSRARRKASTTSGSNCVPAQRSSSTRAARAPIALR